MKVTLIDEETLEIKRYKTYSEADRRLGMSQGYSCCMVRKGIPLHVGGHYYHVFDETEPPFVEDVIWSEPRSRGVKVTNVETGAEGYFKDVEHASRMLGVTESTLRSSACEENRTFGREIAKKLKAEYVDYERVNNCKFCERCECRTLESCKENEDCDVRLIFAKRLRELK